MINDAALDLIKEFEGLRLTAYKDPVGVWTVGYGTTAAAGVGVIPKAGLTITKAEAGRYLAAAVAKFALAIRPKITAPVNDNEFGAFVSLAYNIGPNAFAKSSALKAFNAGDKARAADAILLWNKAGGKVLPGLVRRRQAERELFLRPVSQLSPVSQPAAPTAGTIQPQVAPAAPRQPKPQPAASAPGFWAALVSLIVSYLRSIWNG